MTTGGCVVTTGGCVVTGVVTGAGVVGALKIDIRGNVEYYTKLYI